jgi:two-component system, chemotaxis family, chemotaxis protein CheY
MNILVVDDNKTVQEKLVAMIASQGHCVDYAVNGLDALGKTKTIQHDLYIIDHLMPLMNGIQLVKNLKINPQLSSTPIIFMTTQGIATLKNLTEFSLFDATIEKPIVESELTDLVARFTHSNFDHLDVNNSSQLNTSIY